MKRRYDLVILGSGFAGSLLALIARRLGKTVALLEPGKHPRFAIGESSTPLANLLLEELTTKYALDNIQPLSKWGSWQKCHPEIACGLKRGFTFYGHNKSKPPEELLVAASPNENVADTHWYRQEFDLFILNEAIKAGAEYFDKAKPEQITADNISVNGNEFEASFIIDASGPRGILHQTMELQDQSFPDFPPTKAVFSHFTNVPITKKETIYPPDDAAVHHIFKDGWVWILRFNNGITSVGAALKASFAANSTQPEEIWAKVLDHMPLLKEQFRDAVAVQPFRYLPKLAFRSGRVVGNRWLMLPSAAGFVDPLLSTGFPLTLLGVKRLSKWIENGMPPHDLAEYERITLAELDYVAGLVSALYANMDNFASFKALTLLYFAAASFSEIALRLGKPELIGDHFLLGDHAQFSAKLRTICSMARRPHDTADLLDAIYTAIKPFDVAGLSKMPANNQYPVDFQDLYNGAYKLGATKPGIDAMLRRLGCLV